LVYYWLLLEAIEEYQNTFPNKKRYYSKQPFELKK